MIRTSPPSSSQAVTAKGKACKPMSDASFPPMVTFQQGPDTLSCLLLLCLRVYMNIKNAWWSEYTVLLIKK